MSDELAQVYWERGQLVTLLAKLYPAHVYADPAEPDWPVVCVHMPTGTASWHFPKAAMTSYLATLKVTESDWDGHTTAQKYERLAQMTATLTPAELAAMTARAESAAALAEAAKNGKHEWLKYKYEGSSLVIVVPALARDVLSLLAVYSASQAALTEALAELTAARARIETLEYDLAATQWLRSEAGLE